ncbi:hypothetical protein HH213_08560 [Duganella dendranthematis]|uniref:MBL fold metallo-hydrolase n=1 Tax=Duganella dendranthematis TaxID=2728021 RepID=A0ABX6M758_9BURK|nr:hypothetical protein [Duganella dendranthematis]QJD90143.1 hypothetical protein HH213_08560 [Duganella dendranthematis]
MDLFDVSERLPNRDDVPLSLYAKLDEEPLIDTERKVVFFEFSAISKPDFKKIKYDKNSWMKMWENKINSKGNHNLPSLFQGVKFVNIEFSLSTENHIAKRWLKTHLQQGRRGWYEIELKDRVENDNDLKALVYPNLFSPALAFSVRTAKKIKGKVATTLGAVFSMTSWPAANIADVVNVLSKADATVLAVHDIGQGNACGFRGASDKPVNLWIDIGCGVNRNASTVPSGLVLCYSKSAPILLTHWDKDHWAGARKGAPAAQPNIFLNRTWIVPRQEVGPQHVKFAERIISENGTIFIVDNSNIGTSNLLSIPIQGSRTIEISLGTGANSDDRNNHQCIVIRVLDEMPDRKWLLPGDISYSNMPSKWYEDRYVAIVASHHGADVGSKNVPAPYGTKDDYAVLAFTFGPGNVHGSTSVSHPTHEMTKRYAKIGWGLDGWTTSGNSGDVPPTSKGVATAQHFPAKTGKHLLGKLIGWVEPPAIDGSSPPCGMKCNAALNV